MSLIKQVPELHAGRFMSVDPCVMVVRVTDHTSPNRSRRGDVVAIFPPDHQFSASELANPNWRFIPVDGVREDLRRELVTQKMGEIQQELPDGSIEVYTDTVGFRRTAVDIDDSPATLRRRDLDNRVKAR